MQSSSLFGRARPLVRGDCLMCRTDDLMVFWVGDATMDGLTAPAFMCEPCGDFVAAYIARYLQQRDTRPAS